LPKKDYEIFATNLLNICYQLDDSNSLKENGINSATNTNQIDDEKQTQAFKKSSISQISFQNTTKILLLKTLRTFCGPLL